MIGRSNGAALSTAFIIVILLEHRFFIKLIAIAIAFPVVTREREVYTARFIYLLPLP